MQGHSGAGIRDMVTHHPCNVNAFVGTLLTLLNTQAAVLLHSLGHLLGTQKTHH